MAILDGVPGLRVSIQTENQDLPEYPDQEEWTYRKFAHLPEGLRASTYVECRSDTQFCIKVGLELPYRMDDPYNITFKARVDGHNIAQLTLTRDQYISRDSQFKSWITARYERLSPTQISSRALRFSTIVKVDDPDHARIKRDAKSMADIGEILVSVYRTTQVDAVNSIQPAFGINSLTEVAEKALKGKALSHGVSFGDEQILNRTSKDTYDVDGRDNPIGIFVFKYRSREALQSELIIPRSPSPESAIQIPRSAREENGQISREERLAKLKNEINEIKRESKSARGQKRLRDNEIPNSGRAYKTSRQQDGSTVIDLTDD